MEKVRKSNNAPDYLQKAVKVVFAQLEEDEQKYKDMPASKAIKVFGERAVAALIKEFSQLDQGVMPGKPVVEAVDPTTLTRANIAQALDAINLVKEKRSGTMKARSCANGSKQWKFLKDDESISSPTMGLESLMISFMIDMYEGRDVAIFDIPGAYLHAGIPDDQKILLRFKGEFVDIMCKVNPEHKENIVYEKGKKVLYVRVVRALYGCIQSALLWYNLYSSTLRKMGFELNPYDKCVANKIINGKQCTMTWYVDDNKLSHKDPAVVTEVLEEISKHFGNLTITRGKKHTFLGMNITMRKDKKFEIEMKDQLLETIQSFGEKIEGEVANPATKNLLHIPEEDEDLDEEREKRFHSVVAKLLYLMKRARPDLEPAVSFLCTRVSVCKKSDWNKLKRVLQYVNTTIDDVRVVGASSLDDIFTFVDASYAVHQNF